MAVKSGLASSQYRPAPLQIMSPTQNQMRTNITPKTQQVKNPLLEDANKRKSKAPKVGYSPNKEMQLLEGVKDGTEGVPGAINGVSAFIDGYLRINKRSYKRRT